jgi:hypothetical protein
VEQVWNSRISSELLLLHIMPALQGKDEQFLAVGILDLEKLKSNLND